MRRHQHAVQWPAVVGPDPVLLVDLALLQERGRVEIRQLWEPLPVGTALEHQVATLGVERVDRTQHDRAARSLVGEQVGQPGAVLGRELVAELHRAAWSRRGRRAFADPGPAAAVGACGDLLLLVHEIARIECMISWSSPPGIQIPSTSSRARPPTSGAAASSRPERSLYAGPAVGRSGAPPSAIPAAAPTSAMNTIASRTTSAATSTMLERARPARTIVNSLRNSPNGGDPATARARQQQDGSGQRSDAHDAAHVVDQPAAVPQHEIAAGEEQHRLADRVR